MLKTDQIHEVHRLARGEHWSMRRIARHLRLSTRTVKKYLFAPVPAPVRRSRPSKLDPFKPLIAELLECDLTHKIAVWQGYGLFRFASCNHNQLKNLT